MRCPSSTVVNMSIFFPGSGANDRSVLGLVGIKHDRHKIGPEELGLIPKEINILIRAFLKICILARDLHGCVLESSSDGGPPLPGNGVSYGLGSGL